MHMLLILMHTVRDILRAAKVRPDLPAKLCHVSEKRESILHPFLPEESDCPHRRNKTLHPLPDRYEGVGRRPAVPQAAPPRWEARILPDPAVRSHPGCLLKSRTVC